MIFQYPQPPISSFSTSRMSSVMSTG
ncbi:hypothetical protein PanWU01x14_047510 [Parasponia andersonii]|uniref:Uncharacterized protein n=1 Tax=Parasponia andersonii TaxID=3476 RepID=A0A2P5DN20_PARAD|nr:hypothetical protein PanWU01x14_047510 [Parasponia andersonii]